MPARAGTGGKLIPVRNVLDIHELLTLCAQAVATNDRRRAHELLKQIKQHASETGDATQRLGQCFAKGLEARLVGTGSQLSQLLIMEDRLSIVDFLQAYKLYLAACCFNNVLLIFSRMTIMQAMVVREDCTSWTTCSTCWQIGKVARQW